MREPPGRLTPEEVAELRRWALRVSGNGGDETLRSAAKAVVKLANQVERLSASGDDEWEWGEDGGSMAAGPSPEQLEKARAWARSVLGNGTSAELKAAARAILLLSDDVESLQTGAAVPRRATQAPGRGAPRSAPERERAGGGGGGVGPQVARARRRWRRTHPLTVLAAVIPLAVLFLVFVGFRAASPSLDGEGPENGTVLNAAKAKTASFSVAASSADSVSWSLDGSDASGKATFADGRSTYRPGKLDDGRHTIAASTGGLAPWSAGEASWAVTVDSTPPTIAIPGNTIQVQVRTPYVLKGHVGAGTTLTANGKPAAVDAGGAFSISFPAAPAKPLHLIARDAAGNTSTKSVAFVLVPRRPASPIRAVHVSADAWANDRLRTGVLQLIDEKKINTVEIDLKDESGIVGWDSGVPLAKESGAQQDIFDLEAAVKQLHEMGVRVVGRLVAFRDPILGEWAWTNGKQDMVIQTPDGEAYTGGYGGYSFTNFANREVRDYNIAIAVAAAKLGVDDVLYDYIRRPDGPIDSMVFPGDKADPDRAIASFLAKTQKALEPTGTYLGASVFGISATRPEEIAQNIPLMAEHLDYVSPMVYPSHWGTGEYGLDDPEANPHDIVQRSLVDFKAAVKGTGARVVPWLQDFSLGLEYGPEQVRAQIDAAKQDGIDEFLLWDPEVSYTSSALDPIAKFPATGSATVKTKAYNRPEPKNIATGPAEGPVDSGLAPNELGQVPVLMYHQIVPDGGSEYDLTPQEFRSELDRLWRENYRPITAEDLVDGTIDVPKGTTPVVMTFDDGSASQIGFRPDGSVDPSTAVGIMLDFAKTHPGFRPAATFYTNDNPFDAGADATRILEWLVANGFDVGNHTLDHANLADLSAADVQKQLVLENRVINRSLPDYQVTTMALPFGVMPDPASLAVHGSWDGEDYAFKGVMLVGANPAPSPFSTSFDGTAIPRIRSSPPSEQLENGSSYWLDQFDQNPDARFVSDGDPSTITILPGDIDQVAERFRSKVSQG